MENRILGKSVAILHRREQKYMTKIMKEYGIGYSSYNFLFYLSANPGSSQKETCENMAVDEALAVRTMKKLQEQQLMVSGLEKMASYSEKVLHNIKTQQEEVHGRETE
ncbi:MAG: MarR family winged helix-turn-helix transcriptional regulator [Blautia sp.]|uniref:MarR family winged helix-turn-helix transcriptional regulator n=1 Tax=Blautia sp. TaxID=1955243 RepID=UPI002E7905D2|nr:MarR family winged helix-turn-helix transcriptional regulator [Blautia sp.]MEE1443636.1 MarR family winged helix-turn-helix transcriptional regulator [Blautia sp.]